MSATTGKPVRRLVLTRAGDGDCPIIKSLRERGITSVLASPMVRTKLLAERPALEGSSIRELKERTAIGDPANVVEFLPLDGSAGRGGAAVDLQSKRVLFAGPLVVHGPRAPLDDTDTALWIEKLRLMEKREPAHVVPAIGTWGGPELLERQRRFLTELRRQVGYQVAQGRPHAGLAERICLSSDCLVWTPYGNPTAADIEHVYAELTIPSAPFNGRARTHRKACHMPWS